MSFIDHIAVCCIDLDGYYESQIIGPEGIIIEITQNSKP